MATITTDTFLDGGTACTAGETWTCNGAKFTVRTDTRWHANAPASMTGSLGGITISPTLGGGVEFNATAVRWLPYDTGTGNVPAIGTTITQGGVSGYLLGVWSGLTSAPTAVGAAMPATGFIKFREVTGGAFAAGALTGIGASSTAADRTGWIEVVMDQATTVTVSRLGSGSVARGDWFYLDDTTGAVGQVLQTPTNGGGATTQCPGVWIETGVGTNEYEFWPGLTGSTNGWAVQHLGAPVGLTDRRQSFVKDIGSGQMQIGEAWTSASLTYTITSSSGTYTWANNLVTVTFTAHGYAVGESVYLDFTSGGVTANGVYVIEQVPSANTFTVVVNGAGTSGNVTIRARAVISYANHPFTAGNTFYVNASSGDLVDGVYEVISVVTGASGSLTIAATPSAGTGGSCTLEQTIGRIPVAGCRTRIPNVILRQCATGTRATNAAPHGTLSTRPDFTTTAAGIIDHEYTYGDWYYLTSQSYKTRIQHSATFDAISISETATAIDMLDVGVGMFGSLDAVTLTLTSNFAGGVISGCKFHRGNIPGTTDHAVSISTCAGQQFVNCDAGIIQYGRSSGYGWNLSQSNDLTFSGCRQINGTQFAIATCTNVTVNDLDHVDRFIGYTNASSAGYTYVVSAKSNGVVLDGLTEGYGGAIQRNHAYNGILNVTACNGVKLRNAGSFTSPLSYSVKVNDRQAIYISGGNNSNIAIQRCYVDTVRTNLMTDVNSDKGVLYESVSARYLNTFMPYTWTIAALNATAKGCRAPVNTVAANASVYGSHMYDMFSTWFRGTGTWTWASDVITVSATAHGLQVGDIVSIQYTSGDLASGWETLNVRTVGSTNQFTAFRSGSGTGGNLIFYRGLAQTHSEAIMNQGRICLPMHEPTTETAAAVTVGGGARFTSTPSLVLPTTGSEVTWESQYTIVGHHGFVDSPIILTGAPAVQNVSYTWSANVVSVTQSNHGYLVGDQVYMNRTSGTLPSGIYTISGITSANVFTISLTGSGTSGNANLYRLFHFQYQIDTGSGYGPWRNLDLYKAGVAVTAASTTVTMEDTTGIQVGDKMIAAGLSAPAVVQSVDSGTQITIEDRVVLTGTQLLARFNRISTESPESLAAGFKLKVKASAVTPHSSLVCTYITIPTYSEPQLQQDFLYPLDTNTLTLTGLKNPTEVRIFNAGTTVEVGGQESVTSGTFTTQIDAGTYTNVDASILSLGYQNTRLLNIDMSAGDVTIPVQQIVDRQYLNP